MRLIAQAHFRRLIFWIPELDHIAQALQRTRAADACDAGVGWLIAFLRQTCKGHVQLMLVMLGLSGSIASKNRHS